MYSATAIENHPSRTDLRSTSTVNKDTAAAATIPHAAPKATMAENLCPGITNAPAIMKAKGARSDRPRLLCARSIDEARDGQPNPQADGCVMVPVTEVPSNQAKDTDSPVPFPTNSR